MTHSTTNTTNYQIYLIEKASIVPKVSAKGGKGAKGAAAAKAKSPRAKSSDKSASPKGSKRGGSSKAKKGKGKDSSKPSTPVPLPTEQQLAVRSEPSEPLALQPGSDEYAYLAEPIDTRMCKIMCDHWDVIENTYMGGTKFVFRKIRGEREHIVRYFHTIKTNFSEYLHRPDTKQIEIDAFVKDYNRVADDIRDDDEVKAELHQRVEDLNEKLWSICDNKKVESERERDSTMNNGWLPDKLGTLTNHYITLMQV